MLHRMPSAHVRIRPQPREGGRYPYARVREVMTAVRLAHDEPFAGLVRRSLWTQTPAETQAMTRPLGIILAVALAAVLVPQDTTPAEAAGKKAAKKGTSASRGSYEPLLVGWAKHGTGAPASRRKRRAK